MQVFSLAPRPAARLADKILEGRQRTIVPQPFQPYKLHAASSGILNSRLRNQLPLLIGIGLSIAAHGAFLYGRDSIYTPPRAEMEQGQTVVQLTLIPSMASQPQPEPVVAEETPDIVEEEMPAENIEPEERPPDPDPEPVVEELEPFIVDETSELEIQEAVAPIPIPEKATATPVKTEEAPAATEQIASITEEKGVISDASPIKPFRPNYPRMAQRRGEQGTVMLAITVTAASEVSDVQILQSSGYSRLDKAALAAARKTTFAAATRLGKNIDSTTELSFTFRLTDD